MLDMNIRCGRFTARVHTNIPGLEQQISQQYSELKSSDLVDFSVSLFRSSGARRWYKPQARFVCNGIEPFSPMPISQAYPLFEWGMNWAVTQHFNEALVIHAAVVSKNDAVVIMPGLPGAGKSTLCASLVYGAGWHLLSDELTLYQKVGHCVLSNPRPVSLKNASIDLIASAFGVPMTPKVFDTLKGTVSHTRLDPERVHGVHLKSAPTHIIFPKFDGTLPPKKVIVEPMPSSEAFIMLADNSFNYSVLGAAGFESVKGLIDGCRVSSVRYGGNFDAVFRVFDALTETSDAAV